MKYYTKVVIKSLSEYSTPRDDEKCGTLIEKLYNAINNPYTGIKNIKMSVVKHNHHKAVIKFSCDDVEDFIALKEYFYRNYANSFSWRGWKKLWLVK